MDGAQSTPDVDHPAAGLVGHLDPLAFTGKQHRVITDHITTSDRGEADGFPLTRANVSFTAIKRTGLQIAPKRVSHHLTHLQGRAGR